MKFQKPLALLLILLGVAGMSKTVQGLRGDISQLLGIFLLIVGLELFQRSIRRDIVHEVQDGTAR